ncbi:MAG: hypothetical protein WBB37_05355, partial [bacterium]
MKKLILMILFVFSCSKEDKATVTFWHVMSGPLGKRLEEMIADFNTLHPEGKVKAANMGSYDVLAQKLMGAVASITRPVVLYAPGWSRKVSRVSQPALADLDQAGSVEIIYAGYDSVYAFAPDNSVVPGWPKFFKGVYGLVLGDIDNNGKIEVIALSPESIKVYDYQGAVLSGWPVYIHLE